MDILVAVAAMAVVGFLASLAWFVTGRRGQKGAWLVAGILAFIVGWVVNIATADKEQVTRTYQQCLPDIGRGTMICNDISSNEVRYKTEPFMETLVTTMLETPAEALASLQASA